MPAVPSPHIPTPSPLLAARSITKSFSGVTVLHQVNFDLHAREVHALVGENGAGKSTLMRILAGVLSPDSGSILLHGSPVHLSSPQAALRLGIALIHQEPLSFPDLSIAENIFLGHRIPRHPLGPIDWPAMSHQARQLLASLGLDLNPRARMRGLSLADQQMVELASALSHNARILLMDEPTAALTPREVDRLFAIVRRLCDQGAAIVFISHRLSEIFHIADRITVLRDGHYIDTSPASQTSPDQIIRLMVGRPLSTLYEKPDIPPGQVLLRARGLTRQGKFYGIDLDLPAGQIIGLAGLVGSGRTDLARALFGLDPTDAGSIYIAGRHVSISSPRQAIALGLAYVPEDRQHHGLLLPLSVAANTSLADLPSVSRLGWLLPHREFQIAQTWAQRLRTHLRHLRQPAQELSGGNQQKIVLAKWLQTNPRILILDEPTRGIDVAAKAEVHHLIADLARQGKAILLISSELPEILAMSDHILVMREGRITGRFTRDQATQELIMAAATGQRSNTAATADPLPPHRHHTAPHAARLMRFRELGIAAFVLLTFLFCGALEPRFFAHDSLRSILLYIPLILVMAVGQMMVIVSRNIDLSVGSTLGLAAIVVGNLFITWPHMPLWLAALVAASVGALAGLVNGTLVAFLRVPAIIATLGTLTAYRGLVFIYSGGRQIDNYHLPDSLIRLSQASPIRLPWIVIFAILLAFAAALWLRYSATGRAIFAIGSNPAAAQLRGLPVRRILLLIFTLTGLLSGLAGLMYASRFGYINPVNTGAQMELIVISAVVLGGTNVFGGSGTILGVVLGCLLLGLVNVALPTLGVSAFWQPALYGLAILLAATVDTLLQRYSQSTLAS